MVVAVTDPLSRLPVVVMVGLSVAVVMLLSVAVPSKFTAVVVTVCVSEAVTVAVLSVVTALPLATVVWVAASFTVLGCGPAPRGTPVVGTRHGSGSGDGFRS